MAGGKGKRLRSLTANCPKPMLKIKGTPILEKIIQNAKKYGIINIIISINYLGNRIVNYFGNGKKLGVNIKYIKEKKYLGTAGSLYYVDRKKIKNLIVCNGDIVSDINFFDLFNSHFKKKAAVTIASGIHKVNIPYGVLQTKNNLLKKILEKPTIDFYVNSGIYIFNTNLFSIIKRNKFLLMTNFIEEILRKKNKINVFPLIEKWGDIGLPEDYLFFKK